MDDQVINSEDGVRPTSSNEQQESKINIDINTSETESLNLSEKLIGNNSETIIIDSSDKCGMKGNSIISEVEENVNKSDSKTPETDTKPQESEHVKLVDDKYVYTDPSTKSEYVWDTPAHKWLPKSDNAPEFDGKTYTYTDKTSGAQYKWNIEKKEWEKVDVYGFDGEYHTYTDQKDGTVYIWDREKNAWFPKVDEEFLANYQMNYGFIDNQEKKEEKEEVKEEEELKEKGLKRKMEDPPKWFELDDEHNTKVYVSNLPLDITEQEFVDLMQKCGLIMKDVNTFKWKIRLYTEPDGKSLKGDGLCTYIKKESVELALSILDGYEFKGKKIIVEKAKFQMKGDFNPSLKPKKKRKKEKEKEKKLQEKLFDWRPDKLRGERPKNERTVIIKNLFDPKIFDEKMDLIIEYTNDMREECNKCGTIRKLILHDKHPEGIAQVTFSDAEEADICIKLLNNRWFGKRKITAEQWDGETKYKIVETEEEKNERLKQWSKFLESEEKKQEEENV